MMLRSASTPILNSLVSSYSESPNHSHHSEFYSPKPTLKKQSTHLPGHLHLITPSSPSFISSPSVTSEDRQSSLSKGIRRAQSEGNLEALAASCNGFDEFTIKKYQRKPNCSILQTILSNKSQYNEEDEDEEESDEDIAERNEEMKSEGFSLGNSMAYMSISGFQGQNLFVQEETESKMHLAKGLGAFSGIYSAAGGGNGSGHDDYKPRGFGGDGGDDTSIEEHYKKMVEQNPGNPLFLRNYAQFLHQTKGELVRAEEYYSRAILIDPGDGDVLSQYAQLTWELHRDEERTSGYFERAVQAAPEDCNVLAAYAGFLWEREDEEDTLCTTEIPHENFTAVST